MRICNFLLLMISVFASGQDVFTQTKGTAIAGWNDKEFGSATTPVHSTAIANAPLNTPVISTIRFLADTAKTSSCSWSLKKANGYCRSSSFDLKGYNNKSLKQCQTLCDANKECSEIGSSDYGYCVLNKKGCSTYGQSTRGTNIYQKTCQKPKSTAPVSVKNKASSCSWRKKENAYCDSNSFYLKRYTDKSLKECQTKCDANKECSEIILYSNGYCQLYKKACTEYKSWSGVNIYTRTCQKPASVNSSVSVNTTVKIQDQTPAKTQTNSTNIDGLFTKSQNQEWLSKDEQLLIQQGAEDKKISGMRAKVFKYFNFAIADGEAAYKNLGQCFDACSKWKQKCCASMTTKRGTTRGFQYACINNAIAEGGVKMNLADFEVEIKCNNVWAGAILFKTAIASFMLAFIAFI